MPAPHWIPEQTALKDLAGALTARYTKAVTGRRTYHSLSLPCFESTHAPSTQPWENVAALLAHEATELVGVQLPGTGARTHQMLCVGHLGARWWLH